MADIRRVLLDGYPTVMTRERDELVAADGRTVAVADAVHLAPVEPTKIICCHLNHISRVHEFGVSLPPPGASPTQNTVVTMSFFHG